MQTQDISINEQFDKLIDDASEYDAHKQDFRIRAKDLNFTSDGKLRIVAPATPSTPAPPAPPSTPTGCVLRSRITPSQRLARWRNRIKNYLTHGFTCLRLSKRVHGSFSSPEPKFSLQLSRKQHS